MNRSVLAPLSTYVLVSSALAQQWTAVVLHPPGMRISQVTAVNATHQAGYCIWPTGSTTQAGLWSGSAASWFPFSGAGELAGISGMDEYRQVGGISIPPLGAGMWTGTPESWVSLHPKGYSYSGLAAIRGTMQVGTVRVGPFPEPDTRHAALWRGTPQSFIDLHPTGATWSTAVATDGVLQGGYMEWDATNDMRPVIWNGTAESVVDLRPGGYGFVYGMAPGVQVGQVHEPGMTIAALWRGSAASFVNLNPPGNTLARLRATTGKVHVGAFGQSGASRAGVNFDTPESWVSLHQFLPPEYGSFSEAMCVYQAGDTIYVGGWATRNFGYREAILWIGTLPCYANCDGSTIPPVLNLADFSCFLQRFAEGDGYANCDKSTTAPILNVTDFGCFLQRFAAGCP